MGKALYSYKLRKKQKITSINVAVLNVNMQDALLTENVIIC